jgi:hypothetical protein
MPLADLVWTPGVVFTAAATSAGILMILSFRHGI